uniref:Uncharacterized protein n=1 Tax=Bubo bubo TaxID=30461 RepID=A0A8C0ID83_BUBBB
MEAPAIFTEAEVYQRSFNPQEYLKAFYTLSDSRGQPNTFLTKSLKSLYKMFSLGEFKAELLRSPPPSARFQEILALDYTDQNRRELQKWLKNEAGAFDWSPVVKYVCELEGDREKWAEKEENVRKKVRQVLKCDVTRANP